MKLGAKGPARFESGPNLTPMVDVVMVILIFLMLVGTFATGDWYLEQKAGTFAVASAKVAQPDPNQALDQRINITVKRSGESFVANIDGKLVRDVESVRGLLTSKLTELTAAGNAKDKLTVVIQPDGDVLHRHYFAVYDGALQAGFEKVSFAISN
jgi:biopolymer transport protein ExbD